MPELAEVEYGRKVAAAVAEGQTITAVWCDNDDIVFEGGPEGFHEALVGARVLAVKRHGKQLWMELDRRPWPLFHFGMTGAFRTTDQDPLELASTPKRGEGGWPPRFPKIRMTFDTGAELVMTNKRRLGRIRLRHDPATEDPIAKLGFDPYSAMPDKGEFARLLQRRKSPLKAVLLNQQFAAGVGNWIADEVCYAARLDPRIKAHELTPTECELVRQHLGDIVRFAVSVDADKERFPSHWMFHRRWGKPTDAITEDGHSIEIITLAGRSTAWVPSLQRDVRGER